MGTRLGLTPSQFPPRPQAQDPLYESGLERPSHGTREAVIISTLSPSGHPSSTEERPSQDCGDATDLIRQA